MGFKMLIAITSQNHKTVTKHASKTRRFLVFQVGENQSLHSLDPIDLPKEQSLHEIDRKAPHPIYLMDALITGSCGSNFIERLAAHDVDVYQTETEDPQEAIHEYLTHRRIS